MKCPKPGGPQFPTSYIVSFFVFWIKCPKTGSGFHTSYVEVFLCSVSYSERWLFVLRHWWNWWLSFHNSMKIYFYTSFALKKGKILIFQSSWKSIHICWKIEYDNVLTNLLLMKYGWTQRNTEFHRVKNIIHNYGRGPCGRGRMVVGFITSHAIGAYHH